MELKHIKGIGPAKQKKLNEAGIKSVEDLARADVEAVSKASGINADTLKEHKQAAVGLTLLEDIKGVGPQTVKTLAEAGVRSLKDLYSASADFIAAEAKVAKAKAAEWQVEAQKLAEHVRTESKTPEGRRKLAAEGKDLAQRAAAKTQETAKSLLATAQKEGEAAIKKAQELREKAPEVLQDYRVRAEKALKDAEAKVKELQGKAPEKVKEYQAKAEAAAKDAQAKVAELRVKTEEFAKAEIEKVKAANEGFLGRLRARFQN